ncbi:tumor necrosis factor receptor superfamily member 1B-like [Patiria miniata]|uniref:TNFR-Cys domain-containing protein n=1 Tax=Patiria miniata TaxID=46514 RepID=A0A914BLR9_PATMI|nr:tumor necrosis factor receptor superfamily member 1B-like [Patiria miniata]
MILACLLLMHLFLRANCSEVEQNVASDAYVFRKLLDLIEPRSTSSSKFIPGPNGELCILSDRHMEDRRYEKRDDQGWCCCGLCNAGSYAKKLCKCGGPNGSPTEFTDCVVVKQGIEYMDKANKCSQPYLCSSSCGNHQRKVADCTARIDIKCECVDGWYNAYPSEGRTGPRECRPLPRCPAGQGQERRGGGETGEIVYTCQQCREGLFQQFNNSTATCQPHRVCLVKAGSAVADSVCVNDELQANMSSNATGEPYFPESKGIDTTTEVTQTEQSQKETKGLPTAPPDTGSTQDAPLSTDERKLESDIGMCPAMYVTIGACAFSLVLSIIFVAYCVYVNKYKGQTYSCARVHYDPCRQQVGFPPN